MQRHLVNIAIILQTLLLFNYTAEKLQSIDDIQINPFLDVICYSTCLNNGKICHY